MWSEHGVGDKTSPIGYIPKQDPIQDVLESKTQSAPLKFTLPNGSEMKKMRWASGTPEHFLIHVKGAIHACKVMELYAKFKEAMSAVDTAHLDLDIAKDTFKEKKGDNNNTPSRQVKHSRSQLTRARSPGSLEERILFKQ